MQLFFIVLVSAVATEARNSLSAMTVVTAQLSKTNVHFMWFYS